MAVDPAVLKATVDVLLNEDTRNNIIMIIVIVVTVVFFLLAICAYILLNPLESLKVYFSNEDQVLVEEIKSKYQNNIIMGNITKNGIFCFPLENTESTVITADYGMYDPWNSGVLTKHTGIDLSGVHRDKVLAVYDGIIVFAGSQNSYGNCIEIKHEIDGIEIYTFYAHLSSINVSIEQEVKQGQVIGIEGGDPFIDPNPGNSTGHHLHFEVRTSKDYGNDVDPKEYIYKD